MIKIECTKKPNMSYPLLVDKTYVVGRKSGDITFPDDQSISRTHAELIVEHPQGNICEPMLTPVLVITDVGSKFGSFATEENINNKVMVNAREAVTLSVGDKLRFGLQWHEFRVNYTPLVIVTSGVKPTVDFKNKIVKLGGHLVNEWSVYVTHAVMDKITLTIKAVCALLSAKPIVTQAYLTDLLSSFVTPKPQPDPTAYLPAVIEKGLANIDDSTFYPNTARTTLFAGKTFLFGTQKHLKKLLPAILAGGGNAKLISDAQGVNVLTSEYIIMAQPLDIIVAEKDPSIKAVIDTYRKGRKRFIGDSEIGLAAVYNSIEKHCNPKCSLADTVLPQLITQTQSSSGSGSAVIVPPTQDLESQISSTGNTSRSVVNETAVKHDVSDDDRNSTSSERRDKRPLSSSSTSLSGSSSSKKRSAVDALPERQSKRLKEQLSSKQSSQTSNNSNNRSRAALSNLFGMSDSEDEEPVVVPESQPNESLTVHEEPGVVGETQPNESLSDDDDELNVVPESQPPLLNIVELRNLQSVMDTQESIIVSGRSRGRDDDVFLVPESPPDQSQEGMTRNPGTDHLLTVTESVMNAKTIPSSSFRSVEQNTSPSSSRRLTSQSRRDKKPNDGDGTSRKRQRQEDEEEDLSEHTKKINLDEIKPKIEDSNGELSSTLPLIRLPMVNKNMLRREGSFIEADSESGRTPVKNFKTFKKVLPSFAAGVTSRSSSSSILNVTIEDIQSKRPIVKLVNYDYAPGSSVAYIANLPPLVEDRDDEPPQDVQIDTPPTLEEFGDIIQPPLPKLLSRRNNRRQPEPAAVEEPQSRRRSSPRKKASAVPAPEASSARANAMEVMDEDEEDDDVWGFKR